MIHLRGSFPFARVFVLVVLGFAYLLIPAGASAFVIWPCLGIFYSLAAAAVLKPEFIFNGIPTFVNISVLFMVFYFTIFFLPYQLYVLGVADLGRSVFLHNTFESQSNHAIILATVGLVAFSIGMALVRPRETSGSGAALQHDTGGGTRRVVPLVLAALLGLIGLYQASGWRAEGEGRYTGTTTGGSAAEGVSLLILMLCMISVALLVVRVARQQAVGFALWSAVVVAAAWGGRLLLVGDRNSFFLIAIVAVGGFVTFRVRARRALIVGMVAGAFVLYGAVEITRSLETPSVEAIWAAIVEPKPQSEGADSSFNISTVALRASLEAVPEHIDLGYGKYKVIGIAGVVPLIRGLLVTGNAGFVSSSEVLTYVTLGPSATWSVGSNVISDIYVDLGFLGVPIIMLTLGLFAGWVRRSVVENPNSDRAIVLYLMTLALFAEMPRYSVDFPIRLLAWTALLLGINALLQRGSAGRLRSSPLKATESGSSQTRV